MTTYQQYLRLACFFLFLNFSISPLIAQPDLIVVEDALVNSLAAHTLENNDNCYVEEGCVNGFGLRQILRFTTHIRNVGNQDFYVGAPPADPADANETWEYDECHGHWHYEGYAEYVLFDEDDNLVPIGFKNGFCLIDVECSGGGNFTYNCNNQGISAGCGDIYGSGLDCQWIDVTDVPAGDYKLMIRVNWDEDPDALGNYESSYENNTGAVCFTLEKDANGTASVTVGGNGSSCSNGGECSETTLNLTLDNYPEETSWEILNDENIVVASSGGTYQGTVDGANINRQVCLPEGCYQFIISDSYGDGICCSYGNGSYQLTDDSGNVLGSGSEFQSEDIISFCVELESTCTDEDSDGICAEFDCDDNNSAVPAPPGASCDDGDPNTDNDEIQPDGCSCAGYTANDCDAIHVHPLSNGIMVENIGGFPHLSILLFDANWTTYDSCNENCNNPHTFSSLPAGTYHVSVKPLDDSWQTICNPIFTVEVMDGPCNDADDDGICASLDCDDNDPNLPAPVGSLCNDNDPNTENDIIQSDGCTCAGTGPCVDEDNDGICVPEDCDDTDPNLPLAVGASCDDGNPDTENDMIQSDGCTCEGVTPGGCNVMYIPGPDNITITGLGHPNVSVQVYDNNWSTVYSCFNNCSNPEIVDGLSEGTYYVKTNVWDESWQPICEVIEYVSVTGSCQEGNSCDDNNPCTENDSFDADCNCIGTAVVDEDGDGYCAIIDCDDNDANFPTTPGTSCDDGDPETENDVIAEDGCTCAGMTTGGAGCDAQFQIVDDVLTVNGLDEPNVSVKLMNASTWNVISDCFLDCDQPVVISNLAPGTYYINVQTWDASWQPVCTVGEYLTVGDTENLEGNVNQQFLYFQANKNNRSALLNWATNTESRNKHFELERSKDGINFEKVSESRSMNNRQGTFSYQANDHEPFQGKNYYRLKVVHHDGSFLFSEIKEVEISTNWSDFTIYPNPVNELLVVNLASYEGLNGEIQVYDQLGQLRLSQTIDRISKKAITMDVEELASGFYFLFVELDGNRSLGKRFVKVN
ncbi:MAG: lysyl oxidase family protein [Saprospiraceae bacterium]